MSSINNNLELPLDMKLRVAEYNTSMAVKGIEALETYSTQVKRIATDIKASISSIFVNSENVQLSSIDVPQYLKTLLSTLGYFSRELASSDAKRRAFEGYYTQSVKEYEQLYAQLNGQESTSSR